MKQVLLVLAFTPIAALLIVVPMDPATKFICQLIALGVQCAAAAVYLTDRLK
jgi:hypothetical protein